MHIHLDFTCYLRTRTQHTKFPSTKIPKTRFKHTHQGRSSLRKLRQFATLELFRCESKDQLNSMRSKLGYCIAEGPRSKKPTLNKIVCIRPNTPLNAAIGLDNAEVEFTKNTSN